MDDKSGNSSQGHETPESEIRYVNLYESEDKIYTRRITGFYTRLRRYTGIPLILGFLLMPWLVIDDRPAVWFDLSTRQFHILWQTFWPQDGMLLGWLLIIAAFALFTVTVLFGRVWCGFTCPQTVWTQMFIWAEYVCQGDRNKRMKLDQKGWDFDKLMRKGGTHAIWLAISLVTGLTFVGYFTPVRSLLSFEAGWLSYFWVALFTVMTYMNAGWLREQVCKYMCPYARFQSVMYDKDTLAVSYNAERGEKRGPRKPSEDYKAAGKGDCIDCSWCVQVCPVDIDIRDGAQYECIDCGLCVDACNQVMDKMGYERGLIDFTSETAMKTGHKHILRPRFIGYTLVLVAMVSLFTYTIATRVPLSVDVNRDRGARLYRIKGDEVQNVYTLKIANMDSRAHRYKVVLDGDLPYTLSRYRAVMIESGEVYSTPIRVTVPRAELKQVKTDLNITLVAEDDPSISTGETSVFIGPK